MVRSATWIDPAAGEITVDKWIDRWKATQDAGPSTTENREYLFRRFIRPYWGKRQLNSLTGEEITVWENNLPRTAGCRGARHGMRAACCTQSWATPLEVLLAAERAVLLTGRNDEFTMLVTIGYTGMRLA